MSSQRGGWQCSVVISARGVSGVSCQSDILFSIEQSDRNVSSHLARHLTIIMSHIQQNSLGHFCSDFTLLKISRCWYNRDLSRNVAKAAPVGSCSNDSHEKSNFELEWRNWTKCQHRMGFFSGWTKITWFSENSTSHFIKIYQANHLLDLGLEISNIWFWLKIKLFDAARKNMMKNKQYQKLRIEKMN